MPRSDISAHPPPRPVRRALPLAPLKLVVCVACFLAAGIACRDVPLAPPTFVTVALAVSPDNLDPRIGSDEASQRLHELLFNSLVALDEDLRVVPELATHWDTPDDRTYVVHLRRGVRFHNGRELTAADVAYTFGSFLDPEFVSPRKGAYALVASVAATARYTVEFRLERPFGSFPINLVMGIVPQGTLVGSDGRVVGTGPYELTSYAPDDRVVLTRFDDYFEGPAANPGLVLKIVPDDIMRGLELRKGTIDLVVNDLSPDIVHRLAEDGRVVITTSPGTDYAYVGLNLRDPILRDVRVRRALGFAIDRLAIVRHLRRGLAEPAVGVLSPASWAFEPNVFSFSHDPEQARQLLDQAGFPDPDGKGPLPRFRLSLKTPTAEFVRLQAVVIQQHLQHVGVSVDVRSYEFATLYTDVLRGNFQMYTLQWVGVSDPDMLRRVFHSTQMPPVGFNRVFFEDPRVDRLIDGATESTDDATRAELFGEIQRQTAAAAPYLSLWYKTNVAVSQPWIQGVTLTPTASFSFLQRVSKAPADASPARR